MCVLTVYSLLLIYPCRCQTRTRNGSQNKFKTFYKEAWSIFQFLLNEIDIEWFSSTDIATHMYWSCMSMLKFATYFLPTPLSPLNPLVGKGKSADTVTKKDEQELSKFQRSFFGLMMANCGVHNDRYVYKNIICLFIFIMIIHINVMQLSFYIMLLYVFQHFQGTNMLASGV